MQVSYQSKNRSGTENKPSRIGAYQFCPKGVKRLAPKTTCLQPLYRQKKFEGGESIADEIVRVLRSGAPPGLGILTAMFQQS